MTTILGIDAAWTKCGSSGVSVLKLEKSRWRCVAVAPSYEALGVLAAGGSCDWSLRSSGSTPNAEWLLQAATKLAGEPVALVTIDMPVATNPIHMRRAADRDVSRAFGARWCSAHSPNQQRPGEFGASLTRQFAQLGFPVATAATPPGEARRLVEVYPHPALLTLLQRQQRVPYKVNRASKYWGRIPKPACLSRLLHEFVSIHQGLTQHIDGIPIHLPRVDDVKTFASLKPFEDALDALVCGWVGCLYLARAAYPLGDETSAVWCPTDCSRGKRL
jgi:predicted RNase H-like nuclease